MHRCHCVLVSVVVILLFSNVTIMFIADSASSIADMLQEAEVTVFTLEECEDAYGASEIDDNEHVCVGILGEVMSCNVSILAFEFFHKMTKVHTAVSLLYSCIQTILIGAKFVPLEYII